MPEGQGDKLSSWARLIEALGSLSSKIVWTIVGIIVLAAIGRFLLFKPPVDGPPVERPSEKTTPETIPWHQIDDEIVKSLKRSQASAQRFAEDELVEWTKGLEQRIDSDFLEWYFGYWQQQWMGLKAMGYWIANTAVVEKVIGEQPSMSERITEEIQEEFAKRVLRPQIAQMQIERIADETVRKFVQQVQQDLQTIPERYSIPEPDWNRYLNDVALLTKNVNANREVAVSLKTITVSGVAGGAVATGKVIKAIKPMIKKIGTKMTTKAATKGAGKAAAKVASKTGAKVGGKVGGKFLGPIIGLGVIIWDVWDHQHTKKVEKPILRKNLMDYLAEVRESLLHEPETGLMSIIQSMQSNVVSSLKEHPMKKSRTKPST